MKILVLGAGRVFKHYMQNVFDKEFMSKHELVIYSHSHPNSAYYRDGFTIVRDLEEGLDQKPDFALVLTPSGEHYNDSRACLNRGIHVLCEKPLTLRLDELEELFNKADKSMLAYNCLFQNRLNRTVAHVRRYIENEAIGKIKMCSVKLHWCREQEYYDDKWHGTWRQDGGVTNQQAIHHLDVLGYLGLKAKRVSSKSQTIGSRLEAEDTMLGLIEYENGAIGTIELTTAIRPQDREAEVMLVGESGYIQISGVALNEIKSLCLKNKDMEAELKATSFRVKNGYGITHRDAVQAFIASIENKSGVSDNVDSLRLTHMLVHALYRSSEQDSRWVTVEECKQSARLGL